VHDNVKQGRMKTLADPTRRAVFERIARDGE
jgi:hypothetical protein